MTCSPTVYESPSHNLVPSNHEYSVFMTMAEQAVASKMYRGIGDKAGIMMMILSARELGIPPMSALNGGLNIIQGKVEISARLMSGLIRRAGHSIQVVESTDTICTLKGKRADNGDTFSASFSIQDAQKAGLVKVGGGWTKFPKDMCFARALSRLARQLFSDVIGMGYVEGEIKAAECEIISHPEGMIPVTPLLIAEKEQELKDMVDGMDKLAMMEYVDTVQKHFEWSREKTLTEFLANKEHTLVKFEKWKEKNPC